MISSQALIRFSEQRLNTACLNYEKAYAQPSEETIHDLRVSLRRFLSHLGYLQFAYDQNPKVIQWCQKSHKELKRCLKSLNHLRDLQIQIKYLETLPEAISVPAIFLDGLRTQEKAQSDQLRSQMDAWSLQKIRTKMNLLLSQGALNDQELVLKSHLYLNYLTQELHDSVCHCQKPDLGGCHRLRIRLKGYRYHLETLEQGYGIKQILLGAVRSWQDDLGALQDLRILLDSITQAQALDSGLSALQDHVTAELDTRLLAVKEEVYAIRFETQLK